MSIDRIIFELSQSMNSNFCKEFEVIPWSTPVPVFGDFRSSKLATVGINPSNLEFVDNKGNELSPIDQRFETLGSLKIKDWKAITKSEVAKLAYSYESYFERNPYKKWFNSIDKIINNSGYSYYSHTPLKACHLDLVPYATEEKWSSIKKNKKEVLLGLSEHVLPKILSRSEIEVLVLNGKSVVDQFSNTYDVHMKEKEMESWALPRANGNNITGVKYTARVNKLGGVVLDRDILIFGFNHNIQSSFGVSDKVKRSISHSLKKTIRGFG